MEAVLILLLILLPVGVVVIIFFRYFYNITKESAEANKHIKNERKRFIEKLTNENLKKAQEEYEIENYGKVTGESVSSQLEFETFFDMIETMIDMERYLDKENKDYKKALNIIDKAKRLKSNAEEVFDHVIKFELENRNILKDYYDGKDKAMMGDVMTEFKNIVIELNKALSEVKDLWISEGQLVDKVVK